MTHFGDYLAKRPLLAWLLFALTVGAVLLAGLLTASILERRVEHKRSTQAFEPIPEGETRNWIWGQQFPRQFERYRSTQDSDFASKYLGSHVRDELDDDPRLIILWAGYGFSKAYNQGRGHYRAVEDIRKIYRTGEKSPGTCWSCKSPDVPRMMKQLGVAEFYKTKWMELGPEITNPIGCADCHDPNTMRLTITRPALREAFERQGKDIDQATHQEMRTLVCAQCHVEYYFKGKGKYLTFPWDKGTTVEAMEAYYDEADFADWVHGLSRTPMLKAQHPGYETYLLGTHGQRGVSCADCHMPYRTEGGVKITDHKIQSPLNSISTSCQVCHRESEETLIQTVYDKQDKAKELSSKAKDALVLAHLEAKAAWNAGATEDQMATVLTLIRHAQWRWDFAVAAHGASFHATAEILRILGTSIEKAQEARVQLARILTQLNVTLPIELPDLSTKEKAQSFIGLDMEKIVADKNAFLENVVPVWDEGKQEPSS